MIRFEPVVKPAQFEERAEQAGAAWLVHEATALGGLTGGLVGRLLDARVLALLFGALLLFVALQMIRQLRATMDDFALEFLNLTERNFT